MSHYRIYSLDVNSHISAGRDAECESDDAAVRSAATSFLPGVPYEIWIGDRRVFCSADAIPSLPSEAAISKAERGKIGS